MMVAPLTKLGVQSGRPVRAMTLLVNFPDLFGQGLILPGPRAGVRAPRLPLMLGSVRRACHS